jgi:hypothetical protein
MRLISLHKGSMFHMKLQKQGSTASSTTYNIAETLKQQPYMFNQKVPLMYFSSGHKAPMGVSSNTLNTTSDTLTNNQKIIDNPCKFLCSKPDWDRIVAVVTLGASWQFKDWHDKFQILFNMVKAYCIKLTSLYCTPSYF